MSTSKIINLNRARKSRARDADHAAAEANAVKFGRTKAQKQIEKTAAEKAARQLEEHKRET